jgi:hypothetical protein
MRRLVVLSLVVLLVGLLVGAVAFRGHPAEAHGSNAPGLLDSRSFGFSFGAGPFDQPPTGIHLAYGLWSESQFRYLAVVFDGYVIHPSSQTQQFYAYVASDANARSLADALHASPGENELFGIGGWFEGRTTHGGGGGDQQLAISQNDRIDYFKLIVPPFTIERSESSGPIGSTPIPGYEFHPSTNEAETVEAYGLADAGDADCDMGSDSIDSLLMLQHDAGLLKVLPCAKAADASGDGTIDSVDASLVLQFAAGLIAQP